MWSSEFPVTFAIEGGRRRFFPVLKASDFRAEPFRSGVKRIVRKINISFGCCRDRVPEQLSDDFEAEPARNEVGLMGVPVVVAATVGHPSRS